MPVLPRSLGSYHASVAVGLQWGTRQGTGEEGAWILAGSLVLVRLPAPCNAQHFMLNPVAQRPVGAEGVRTPLPSRLAGVPFRDRTEPYRSGGSVGPFHGWNFSILTPLHHPLSPTFPMLPAPGCRPSSSRHDPLPLTALTHTHLPSDQSAFGFLRSFVRPGSARCRGSLLVVSDWGQ